MNDGFKTRFWTAGEEEGRYDSVSKKRDVASERTEVKNSGKATENNFYICGVITENV
jgi:hypothetical protein